MQSKSKVVPIESTAPQISRQKSNIVRRYVVDGETLECRERWKSEWLVGGKRLSQAWECGYINQNPWTLEVGLAQCTPIVACFSLRLVQFISTLCIQYGAEAFWNWMAAHATTDACKPIFDE